MNDPMNRVEGTNAMRDAAALVHAFYQSLVEEGFSKKDALQLTREYVAAIANTGSSGDRGDE